VEFTIVSMGTTQIDRKTTVTSSSTKVVPLLCALLILLTFHVLGCEYYRRSGEHKHHCRLTARTGSVAGKMLLRVTEVLRKPCGGKLCDLLEGSRFGKQMRRALNDFDLLAGAA
jgi:hypothetical protein